MRTDRAQLMIGAEITYGVDPTLTAGTNVLMVKDLTTPKLSLQQDAAEFSKEYLGAGDRWAVSSYQGLSFALPIVGTGTPLGTPLPAPMKACYTACGLSIVDTPTTNSVLAPVSVNEGSSYLHANIDGHRRRMAGVRGNVKWVLEEGKIGWALFDFLGLTVAASDTAIAAGTYAALQAPAAFNKNNSTVTWGGVSFKCKKVEVDLGRTHEYRNIAGEEAVINTGQASKASLMVELPTVATKDVINDLVSASSQALSIVHGVTAGRIWTGAAPVAIPAGDPTFSSEKGRLFATIALELRPNGTGNNAITWTLT